MSPSILQVSVTSVRTIFHVTDPGRSIGLCGRLGPELFRRTGPPGHGIFFLGKGLNKLEFIQSKGSMGSQCLDGIHELWLMSMDWKCVGPVILAPGLSFNL